MKSLLIALTLAAATFSAQGEVFKCRGPDGKVTYQAAPCKGGEEMNIEPAPKVQEGAAREPGDMRAPPKNETGLRESELRFLDRAASEHRDAAKAQAQYQKYMLRRKAIEFNQKQADEENKRLREEMEERQWRRRGTR